MMVKYHVYILKSRKDGKFYIGSTSNLDERLKRHTKGMVKATRHRRPLELIYSEEFLTRVEAVRREFYLKRLRNNEYIKRLLGLD